MESDDPLEVVETTAGRSGDLPAETTFVKVEEVRPEGYDGTCLRPLGLCELGGCCDACWYRPDHPRFQKKR